MEAGLEDLGDVLSGDYSKGGTSGIAGDVAMRKGEEAKGKIGELGSKARQGLGLGMGSGTESAGDVAMRKGEEAKGKIGELGSKAKRTAQDIGKSITGRD